MPAIAIDGPAGAGKSTLSRALAEKIGYIYVDTGALYRAVALSIIRGGINLEDNAAVEAHLKGEKVTITRENGEQHVFLNGEDVSNEIRTPEISMKASACSALPEVRAFLLELQRSLANDYDVVMDGRDIGTVVLPNAELKIFLTAKPEARALRRYNELCEKGEAVSYDEVLADMIKRDYNDTHRKFSPLAAAEDSVLVDTTECSLEQSLEKLFKVVKEAKI